MTRDEVLEIFSKCGAILNGHFILTSGLHSPVYLQKARVFMYPDQTEILCKALAAKIKDSDLGSIDFVISPALGGLVPGYETARHLGVPAMWVERENGKFMLKRFEIPKNARIIIIEDIVTTGLSIKETIQCVTDLGVSVVGSACLIDRSSGEVDFGVKLVSLADYKVPVYTTENLPEELAKIPAIKPGSREMNI